MEEMSLEEHLSIDLNSDEEDDNNLKYENKIEEILNINKNETIISQLVLDSKSFNVRHSSILSLKPYSWLEYPVIEYYLNACILKNKLSKSLLYISGVTIDAIMNDNKTLLKYYSLDEIDTDNYQGAISFHNMSSRHWQLIFINGLSGTIYFIDSVESTNEKCEAIKLEKQLRRYFKLRHLKLNNSQKWVETNWKVNIIPHDFQTDRNSCGVYVAKFAEQLIQMFPQLPDRLQLLGDEKSIEEVRLQMAENIYTSGEPKDSFCGICGDVCQENSLEKCKSCGTGIHRDCLKAYFEGNTKQQTTIEGCKHLSCLLCIERKNDKKESVNEQGTSFFLWLFLYLLDSVSKIGQPINYFIKNFRKSFQNCLGFYKPKKEVETRYNCYHDRVCIDIAGY